MNIKLLIGIIVLGLLVVGCEQAEERLVESCDECKNEENCIHWVNGSNSCRIETEEEKQGYTEFQQEMNNYRCYLGCQGFQGEEWITNKVCDCYNKNNVSYNVDFRCSENTHYCESLSFEDKKKMAMIDDHWYCVCNEKVEGYYCETEYNYETGCRNRNIENKKFNRTTEFIWSY